MPFVIIKGDVYIQFLESVAMNELRIAKDRLLRMCAKLTEGHVLYKQEEAAKYGCSLRSIQRDFDDLRAFFDDRNMETGMHQELIYDRMLNGYRLEPPIRALLTDEETYAVIKILLESRALTKKELKPILTKLVNCCVPEDHQKQISELVSNETYHYVEPRHKKAVLKTMWALSGAVNEKRFVNFTYRTKYSKMIQRTVRPAGILFSEYYFYLIAFIDTEQSKEYDKTLKEYRYPAIYRIDRIQRLKISKECFKGLYANRFEEGEFRKRVQFMWQGELQKVKFYVQEKSLEAVLDRLPAAKVIKQDEKGYLVEAEAYGEGIHMWLRSQGEWVEVIK